MNKINILNNIIKTISLGIVLMIVVTVCNAKFDYLRKQTGYYSEGHVSAAEVSKQLDCLSRNIYWEAAGEPFEGKVGVAQVTMNRMESGKYASSVCGVVYQKNIFYEKVVCQFSWFCEMGNKLPPVNSARYKESEEVAKKVLLEGFRLPGLKDALHYHATYISPGWKKEKIATIGQHVFYK